jgi:hypothetical protein
LRKQTWEEDPATTKARLIATRRQEEDIQEIGFIKMDHLSQNSTSTKKKIMAN